MKFSDSIVMCLTIQQSDKKSERPKQVNTLTSNGLHPLLLQKEGKSKMSVFQGRPSSRGQRGMDEVQWSIPVIRIPSFVHPTFTMFGGQSSSPQGVPGKEREQIKVCRVLWT